MTTFTSEQSARREKTLLTALLLSMWAPLATGFAVVMSTSTTQLADFIRRSVELVALFVSWWMFRYINRNRDIDRIKKAKMELVTGICVSVALFISALVMLIIAFSRTTDFEPGGNVYPGLVIAVLGFITNTWFWRRYTKLNREQYSSIIDSQGQLYRAKAFVDLCVIAALSTVLVIPSHPVSWYTDLIGSVVLACYLLWSSFKAAQKAILIFSDGSRKYISGDEGYK